MGDSDEEYERRRRDKFRPERREYTDRRADSRREGWDERYSGGGGGYRGGRGDHFRRDSGPRRDFYYEKRRERYSPVRNDMSPPHKRMKTEWEDRGNFGAAGGGGGGNYDNQSYGGGGGNVHSGPPSHGGGGGGWGSGGAGNMSPPAQQPYSAPAPRGPEPEGIFPTQPPMMSFKQFLASQDDHITDEEAIKKFNDYKMEFRKQQLNEFFLAHKEEEWFKSKYHPEECEKRKDEATRAIQHRCNVFMKLVELGRLQGVSCDVNKSIEIVKFLDAAVILMEGGREFDLRALDEEPSHVSEGHRSRQTSESQPSVEPVVKRVSECEGEIKEGPDSDGELSDDPEDEQMEEKDMKETPEKAQSKAKAEEFPSDTVVSPDQEQPEQPENGQKKKTKAYRNRSDQYYGSGSDSDSGSASGSDSEEEPAPPGEDDDEPLPPGVDGANDEDPPPDGNDKESDHEDEKEEDEQEKTAAAPVTPTQLGPSIQVDLSKPQALHKTCSIFLRNLAPTITKQEVEAMCRRYPGFMRVALQDPQPERRFHRRGWVTFDRTVNIKDICWNLNNIRLRDCEMGAIVNRELKGRVRPINGITAHKQVVRSDIKHAARIIQAMDKHWGLWQDKPGDEKKDQEKALPSFGMESKNPMLKNITDYLVEEGDYLEEELLGMVHNEMPKEMNPDVAIERDEELNAVLDRMILYLRVVHSFDYYSTVEYPNEDEMPHRCGIMHSRGAPPANRLSQNDLSDYIRQYEIKVQPFIELKHTLDNVEMDRLGKKDEEAELEKFVQANMQELAKDKWLCPLSGKKFKGPEFVRKHIFNKHAEKVEEAKLEVQYFNNFLADPKRPMLPEHPGNRRQGGSGGQDGGYNNSNQGGGGGYMGGYQGPPQGGGYHRGGPPNSYHGNRGYGSRGFGGYRKNGPPNYGGGYHNRGHMYQNRDRYQQRPRDSHRGRSDPRHIIEYRDLDAPDDAEMF